VIDEEQSETDTGSAPTDRDPRERSGLSLPDASKDRNLATLPEIARSYTPASNLMTADRAEAGMTEPEL
jgi:hypothetical protein